MNLKTFKLPYGKHMLCGDVYGTGKQTVVLHGAGNSSRSVFSRLRHILNTHSIPSVSFDFIGHGETGGELLGSSLHERTKQATAVIKHKCIEPVTLIAASMSGYTAIKLTDKISVSNLILLVPAIYSTQAYNLPFGHEFSAAIRTPKSWKDSDAFEILSRFKGNLVVIAAEFDDVIPREIIVQIHSAAKNAANRILHVISGSTHTTLFPREQDFLLAMEIILGACLNEWGAKRLESKTRL